MSQPETEEHSRPPSQASNPNAGSESNNNSSPNPNQSQPASKAGSRSTSQASNRPASQASNKEDPPSHQSRPASQASNKPSSRPASQASKPPSKPSSKAPSRTTSPSISREPRQTPRGRSRTPRSLSSASSMHNGGSDEENRAPTPTADHPEPESELPDVEEEGEDDRGVVADENQDEGGDGKGKDKKKRRRRGKKSTKGFGVNKWPHGDNPGRMEPPHGVNDWPHVDEEGEGVGTSGRVLQRPKGVRDFSPAYAPSDAGSNASLNSSVSGLSLGDWSRSSLPGVDTWPYGDNPGIMVKPLDHWGKPLKNPDGTLVQKENWTGLPSYDELREMDLDTHDDHVIKLKLELDIDVAVEINARIHGDLTLALLSESFFLPQRQIRWMKLATMRFLPPKKTHLAILVVGVAFFAQAVAAPAPPKPENEFLMSGGVGGQDQTTTTQNDPEQKSTMSSGVRGQHESESTQEPSDVISPMNDPDYGSFSGAAQGINEPDGLLDRNTPMIHATLYISSHLESMYPNFPNLSGYKRPVQKMLNTVKMDTLLRALKSKDSSLSKLRSKDVGKRVVITKVITDEEIQSPNAFILRFSLSVPKTKDSEPSFDSETELRYTGEIVWDDGCIDKMEDGRNKLYNT
ncbi:hypothetical protein EV360DRAFT_75377 [Lentinula raphanica]|nr:hypothetical protein EV360DRAFT_75377 [Lentinula raphanica]